jgi:hypothetical protein
MQMRVIDTGAARFERCRGHEPTLQASGPGVPITDHRGDGMRYRPEQVGLRSAVGGRPAAAPEGDLHLG